MSEVIGDIIERFARFRAQKVASNLKGGTNSEKLVEVAKETTVTLLNLVHIQFGSFGLREIVERLKDFVDWEASQIAIATSENKLEPMYS